MTEATCPYCRMAVQAPTEDETLSAPDENTATADGDGLQEGAVASLMVEAEGMLCPACRTPHHRDCWEENGGCTVFGCSAAPVEEAAIRVSSDEMTGGMASAAGGGAWASPGPTNGAANTLGGWGQDSTGIAPPPQSFPAWQAPPHYSGYVDPNASPIALSGLNPQSSVERRIYVGLAIVGGFLGIHNLYANRTSAGIIQLCTTFTTCFLALPVTWIWALVEAGTVEIDGDGFPMK